MKMIPSRILQRWRENKPILLFLATPTYHDWFIGMAAINGYHGVWIDAQHQNYSEDQIAHICLACREGGLDAIVRVRKRDRGSYSKALEWGAHGIIVPHINSAAEAREIVRELKFPPDGNRGIDGVEPPAHWGYLPGAEYVKQANAETYIIVQIEEPEAVENVEEIAAVKGIDCLMIGPADLTLRLGCFVNLKDPRAWAAVERVAAAAKKTGKHWGLPVPNIEKAKEYLAMGARFFVYGSPYSFVRNGIEQVKKDFGPLFDMDQPRPAHDRGY